MKKLSQKGFGAVEILLLVVLAGLIGGVGYYVYNQSKNNDTPPLASNQPAAKKEKTKEPEVKDETADWLQYESPDKVYKIRLADGWKLYHYATGSTKNDLESDYSKETVYKSGTKAKVEVRTEGGRGGLAYFGVRYNPEDGCGASGPKQAAIKTQTGLIGAKYLYDSSKDPEYDGMYGSYKSNIYEFNKDNKKICIYYDETSDDSPEKLETVELVVKSLEL